MTYLDWLRNNEQMFKPKIDQILRERNVQIVGDGYIDLITIMERVAELINKLTANNVIIDGVSWWCHCTEESQAKLGCPHGMGGPRSKHYEGWFSEMQIPMFELQIPILDVINKDSVEVDLDKLSNEVQSINQKVKNYLINYQNNDWYSPCLTPALWLHVPDEWKSPNELW